MKNKELKMICLMLMQTNQRLSQILIVIMPSLKDKKVLDMVQEMEEEYKVLGDQVKKVAISLEK